MVLSKKLVIEQMGLKTSGFGHILKEYKMGKGKLATVEVLTCSGVLDKNGKYFNEFKPIEIYEDFGPTIYGVFKVKVQSIDNNYIE